MAFIIYIWPLHKSKFSYFCSISIDTTTGQVSIESLDNQFGEQVFTLTATDISGNSNTCTFWVGPEGECEDVPGAALRSNGGSQLVSVPDDPSLDLECAMTLEAWVNPSSYYIWGAIILKAAGKFARKHTINRMK